MSEKPPDIWGLLQEAKQFIDEWVDSSNGGPLSMALSNAVADQYRWQLVPREPDDVMRANGLASMDRAIMQFPAEGSRKAIADACYRAMLAAAPTPKKSC